MRGVVSPSVFWLPHKSQGHFFHTYHVHSRTCRQGRLCWTDAAEKTHQQIGFDVLTHVRRTRGAPKEHRYNNALLSTWYTISIYQEMTRDYVRLPMAWVISEKQTSVNASSLCSPKMLKEPVICSKVLLSIVFRIFRGLYIWLKPFKSQVC